MKLIALIALLLMGCASAPEVPVDTKPLEWGPGACPWCIRCFATTEDGTLAACIAPCGCVFSGFNGQLVTCPHGQWRLDP